ncbi:MAG: hypothetical protein WAO74_11520 [Polaribacter sp.]|uniref:hypothetical protein n=1 Tax=Polaribacter sp. TaxID=1920175 RepID=UPI003BB0CFF6
MKIKHQILIVIYLLNNLLLFSQNDTINISNNDRIVNQLKEGINKYLVYVETKDSTLVDIGIYERKVEFEKINGEEVVRITQNIKNQNPEKSIFSYSISKRKNFEPISHFTKNGKGVIIDSINFIHENIYRSKNQTKDSKKIFLKKYKGKGVNFELDLEVLQILPYQLGKSFIINFYFSKGEKLPIYREYKVIGENQLLTVNKIKIDCWILKVNYTKFNSAIFWVDKKSNQVLKMVEVFHDVKRYKIKMP